MIKEKSFGSVVSSFGSCFQKVTQLVDIKALETRFTGVERCPIRIRLWTALRITHAYYASPVT